jgi:hypothetical protein
MDNAFREKMFTAQIDKACRMCLDETDGPACLEYCQDTIRFIKQANKDRAALQQANNAAASDA